MAFSESFDIENTILKHLEEAVESKGVIPIIEDKLQSQSTSKEVLEVVDVSPTSNLSMKKTRSGHRSFKKVFKNKKGEKSAESNKINDGAIPEISNTMSEFFESEISFKDNIENIKFDTFSFCSLDLNHCYDKHLKHVFLSNDSNISKTETNQKCDKNTNTEKNKCLESVQNNLDLKEEINEINEGTFDLNVLNTTLNPSFLYIPIISEDKTGLMTEELREIKKDLSLLSDQEEQNFLNLTARLENLSTSEKPLLHFSISSDDSLEEGTDKEKTFQQNYKRQSAIAVISNNSFKLSSEDKERTYENINSASEIIDLENRNNIVTDMNKWNLPITVLNEYKKKGITKMFDWQGECLSNPKVVLENKNLVYSAPTSAGKTLISEILSIKSILERNKKVVFILPFVSVVREKMLYFQDLLSSSGCRVEGFFGGYSPPGGFESVNLAICTIEKANSIINRLLEQGKMENLGCVVIDEIHLISDPGRGYILELLLAKILYMSKKLNYNIQIITMSATLPNCKLLTNWLNAEMYSTNFRPVELKEMIKIGKNIYNKELNLIRVLDSLLIPETQNDQDDITLLSIETILQGCSVIIFCPSKEWCENLSQNLSKTIKSLCNSNSDIGLKMLKIINKDILLDVVKRLKSLITGCDKILKSTFEYGCAFHHAGLTVEERDIVENTFRSGLLKIIVATSTLSCGVNLPARRVIIRSPLFGRMPMDSLTYKQMIGRAGRTGKDTLGESILICTESNAKIGKELVGAVLKPISSCLGYDNGVHLKRAVLEIICSGVAKTRSDLIFFLNCTLYSISNTYKNHCNEIDEENAIEQCINFLKEYEFIRIQQNNEVEEIYVASRLGKACLASSLPPTDGIMLFSELQRSRRCFVLESELHAVYLVTPYSVCYQLQNIDWLHFLDVWERLSPGNKKVAEIVGVKESFLVRAMRCQNKLDFKLLQIHKRFYSALALQELVNEVPISSVAKKFKCNRGLLQSLQQMSSTFASIVAAFCDALNWKTLSLIVSQFKERLYFGVHRDLIDLMRLPDINSQRARSLFNAGIENLVTLANSHVFVIEKILYDSLSFQSSRKQEGEDEYEVQKRNVIRKIYVTGKVDLSIKDAAEMLITNARTFLQYEIGVKCNWGNELTTDKKKFFVQSSASSDNIVNNNIQDKDKCFDEIKELKNNVQDALDINELNYPLQQIEKKKLEIENSESSVILNSPLTKKKKINSKFIRVNSEEKSQYLKCKEQLIKSKENKKIKDEESIEISVLSNGSIIKDPNLLNNLINNENKNLTQSGTISIIDAEENMEFYQIYLTKIFEAKHVGFSIGIEKLATTNQCNTVIGANIFLKEQREIKNFNSKQFMIDNMNYVAGVSFSLEENISIFIDLQNLKEDTNTFQYKLEFLQKIFSSKELTLRIYDSKEQIKILEKVLIQNCKLQNNIEDPKIASWLLEPDLEMNLTKMVSKYAPKYKILLEEMNYKGFQSLSLNCNFLCTGKIRACYDACITNSILKNQLESLENFADGQMKKFFHELEMPIQKILAHCEVIGFSINSDKIEKLTQTMVDLMKNLETKIYQLHGSHFNLGSTAAVARVLGLHRKPNGKLSTSKQILERIDSPISNLIINYRKISTIFTKNIKPLQKIIQNNRIHGNSFTISSTGRMSMCEPNIQNVAKDFNIEFDDKIIKISCRSIFLCPIGRVLLSADFCQLEMRILTHLSQDKILQTVIHSNKDIFTAIAAKWNNISENDVSEKLRNGTKQICYGIIYGMGIKTLSENLKCTEQEALSICEQFHSTYPGIRAYIQKIIRFAKQNGFVETITGRRRYLEHINSIESSIRNQAERQSVNTTIQGSAADIVKSAMLRMEKNIMKYNLKLGINVPNKLNTQVEFVLHLHDELIYEVPEEKVRNVAKVLKATMENCVKLSVPLKVKLKSGKSWGEMIDLNI